MPISIKIPEHNSSRLMFVDIPEGTELLLEDTTDPNENKEKHNELDGYQYQCDFELGRLTKNIWLLEDFGEYDMNHEHTCNLYYMNGNNKEIIYNVRRVMEYSGECDRLYCQNSSSLKTILLDSPEDDQYANFYIKYERFKAPAFEGYNLMNTITNETIPNAIGFFTYNDNNQIIVQDGVQINFGISVVDQNKEPIEDIHYCNITPITYNCDFSKISIKYSIAANETNEPLVGFVTIKSLTNIQPQAQYAGKFVAYRYYTDNEEMFEPAYFIIQAPKNRSWICYRTCYSDDDCGLDIGDLISSQMSTKRKMNGCRCVYINRIGASLNGFYGTYVANQNKYVYEISIDHSIEKPFYFMLPKIFCNYSEMIFLNELGNQVNYVNNRDYPREEVFNDLDGMFYKIIPILSNSNIYKIRLEYSVA